MAGTLGIGRRAPLLLAATVLCLALVLAAAMFLSGSSRRKATVGPRTNGPVQSFEETRSSTGLLNLMEFRGRARLNLIEMTVSGVGTNGLQVASIELYVRPSGVTGCSGLSAITDTRYVLRSLVQQANQPTVQVTFPKFLRTPTAPRGRQACLAADVVTPAATSITLAGTGFLTF